MTDNIRLYSFSADTGLVIKNVDPDDARCQQPAHIGARRQQDDGNRAFDAGMTAANGFHELEAAHRAHVDIA